MDVNDIYEWVPEKHIDTKLVQFNLLESQVNVQRYMLFEKCKKNSGLLLYHGVGTGKTLASLSIAANFDYPVVVLCSRVLRFVWQNESILYTFPKSITFIHYEMDINVIIREIKRRKCTIIVDEVHNLWKYPPEYYTQILETVQKCRVRLLLSGTPINDLHQITGLANVAAGEDIYVTSMVEFVERYFTENTSLTYLLQVMYYITDCLQKLIFKDMRFKFNPDFNKQYSNLLLGSVSNYPTLSYLMSNPLMFIAGQLFWILGFIGYFPLYLATSQHLKRLAEDISPHVSFLISERSIKQYPVTEHLDNVYVDPVNIHHITRLSNFKVSTELVNSVLAGNNPTEGKIKGMSKYMSTLDLATRISNVAINTFTIWSDRQPAMIRDETGNYHWKERKNIKLTTMAQYCVTMINTHKRVIFYSGKDPELSVNILSAYLSQMKIRHGIISNRTTENVIYMFNTGIIDVALIQRDYVEGYTLKNCRRIVVMSVIDYGSRTQLVGRIRRINSLDGCSEREQRDGIHLHQVISSIPDATTSTDSSTEDLIKKGEIITDMLITSIGMMTGYTSIILVLFGLGLSPVRSVYGIVTSGWTFVSSGFRKLFNKLTDKSLSVDRYLDLSSHNINILSSDRYQYRQVALQESKIFEFTKYLKDHNVQTSSLFQYDTECPPCDPWPQYRGNLQTCHRK